jgi:hypothetical protein
MVCRCGEISELWDSDAKAYAERHVEQVEARAGSWEAVYRCPDSEHTWLASLHNPSVPSRAFILRVNRIAAPACSMA